MPCFQIKDEKDDDTTEIHEKVKSRNYKINTVVKTKRKKLVFQNVWHDREMTEIRNLERLEI